MKKSMAISGGSEPQNITGTLTGASPEPSVSKSRYIRGVKELARHRAGGKLTREC
jgi:hypothetical protein